MWDRVGRQGLCRHATRDRRLSASAAELVTVHRSWAWLGSSATAAKGGAQPAASAPVPLLLCFLGPQRLELFPVLLLGRKTHKHADHACAVWGAALSVNRNSQHPVWKQRKGPPVWLLHTLGS